MNKLYFSLSTDNGHISTIIVENNDISQMKDKVKLAFNEDMNCKVTDMSKFELEDGLEGKTGAILVKYELEEFDYEEADAPERETTTIFFNQTWLY